MKAPSDRHIEQRFTGSEVLLYVEDNFSMWQDVFGHECEKRFQDFERGWGLHLYARFLRWEYRDYFRSSNTGKNARSKIYVEREALLVRRAPLGFP
jgi:hypothetical protein